MSFIIEDLSTIFRPMPDLHTSKEIIVFRYPHTSLGSNITQPEVYQALSSNPSYNEVCHDCDGDYEDEITEPDLRMWRWH